MKVGSLVECVNTDCDSGWEHLTLPKKGIIYTVRSIIHVECGSGITLEEIINKPEFYKQGFYEMHFTMECFRELQPPLDLSELLEEKVTA